MGALWKMEAEMVKNDLFLFRIQGNLVTRYCDVCKTLLLVTLLLPNLFPMIYYTHGCEQYKFAIWSIRKYMRPQKWRILTTSGPVVGISFLKP